MRDASPRMQCGWRHHRWVCLLSVVTFAAATGTLSAQNATAPFVDRVEVTSDPRGTYGYRAGETIEIQVQFNKPVTFSDGEPELVLTLDNREVRAKWTRTEGGTLSFEYTVEVGDVARRGISIAADALEPKHAEIVDSKNVSAVLNLGELEINEAGSHRVNRGWLWWIAKPFDSVEWQEWIGAVAAVMLLLLSAPHTYTYYFRPVRIRLAVTPQIHIKNDYVDVPAVGLRFAVHAKGAPTRSKEIGYIHAVVRDDRKRTCSLFAYEGVGDDGRHAFARIMTGGESIGWYVVLTTPGEDAVRRLNSWLGTYLAGGLSESDVALLDRARSRLFLEDEIEESDRTSMSKMVSNTNSEGAKGSAFFFTSGEYKMELCVRNARGIPQAREQFAFRIDDERSRILSSRFGTEARVAVIRFGQNGAVRRAP